MPPDINQAAVAFNDWRTTRTTRGHTPADLKALAVSLVAHYPITQICERLNINTRALKAWKQPQTPPAEFVTIANSSMPAPAQSLPELTLRISTSSGTELQLTGALEPAFIASLSNAMKTEAG